MTTDIIAEKQPKGLNLLVFTEAWERFGYYTVQTIIILFMTKSLGYSDDKAYSLFAACTALMYLTPTLGGYIADRYLGFQKTILIGGVLLMLAYIFCSIPGYFFLGLSILICANGLFKPNISSILGDLYRENDPRREGGFTLFYMGINVGSLVPPIIVGYFASRDDFLLAALGMVIALITFSLGRKQLKHCGKTPAHSILNKPGSGKYWFYTIFGVGLVAAISLARLVIHYPASTNVTVIGITAMIILAALTIIFRQNKSDRNKMLVSLVLIIISIGFWAIYNQTFTSLMLFADRNMNHDVLGFNITTEMTQFFNPFFIVVLSPILSMLWIKLSKKELNPSIPNKFTLAVFAMSVGFILLAIGTRYFSNAVGVSSAWWLIGSYFIQTVGELLLSPIGLAMITVLIPKPFVGMMMGVWFFSQAAAFALGGPLADIAAIPASVTDDVTKAHIYAHAFFIYGGLAAALAVASLCCLPFLRKLLAPQNP